MTTISASDIYSAAREYARTWVVDNTVPPATLRDTDRQRLMLELADRCAEEAVRMGGSEAEITSYLTAALGLLHEIWGTYFEVSVDENLAGKPFPQSRWDRSELLAFTIPLRRDPAIALREGVMSWHSLDLSDSVLPWCTATYLEQDWLANPLIDYMLLDLHVSHCLCELGYELREKPSGKLRRQWKAGYALWEEIGNRLADAEALCAAFSASVQTGLELPTEVATIIERAMLRSKRAPLKSAA